MAARKSTSTAPTAPVVVTADTSKLSGPQAKSLARLSDDFKTALNEGRISTWVAYKVSIFAPEHQAALYAATLAKNIKPTTSVLDGITRSVATGASFEGALASDPKALSEAAKTLRVRSEVPTKRGTKNTKSAPRRGEDAGVALATPMLTVAA